MNRPDPETLYLVGELIFALQEAATLLACKNKSAQAGEFANLIRKGCSDYDQSNPTETYFLTRFAVDARNYWHQNQTGKRKPDMGLVDSSIFAQLDIDVELGTVIGGADHDPA